MVDSLLRFLYHYEHPALHRELQGLKFKNPIGLAAGFDKNADLINQISSLGFGFVEIGTVTPLPQEGNEKPRLFRLKKDQALINRMGFNNEGVEVIEDNLSKLKGSLIVGGNIGKNKLTPNDQAYKDYEICFNVLFDRVDYFVVNVSSPNTPDLRELQERKPLEKILSHLQDLNRQKRKPKPIFLKIAPDLNNRQLDEIIEIINATGIHGVVATNTTIERKNLKTKPEKIEQIGSGGLSGKPLSHRSTEVVRYLSEKSNRSFPIIAVGGIHSPADAIEKLQVGASLLQLYTGFIYEGPALIKKIKKHLAKESICTNYL